VARADFAYVNDGALDELDAFVEAVLDRLQRRSPSRRRLSDA
jgi:hypothetical protein